MKRFLSLLGILGMLAPTLLFAGKTYHSGTKVGEYSDFVGTNGRVEGRACFGVGNDIRISSGVTGSGVFGSGYVTKSNSWLFGNASTDNITVANMLKFTGDSCILPSTRFTASAEVGGNFLLGGVAKSLIVGDGGFLVFTDGTLADSVTMVHDGTDFVVTGDAGTGMFELEGMDIELKNGGKIENSTTSLMTFTEATVDVVGILTANSIASDAGVSGTTITGTGKISTTVTTEQLRLGYDATNYLTVTLADDGHTSVVTVDPDGAEADINFDPDGNVGIKTADPSVALEVTGAGMFSTDLTVTGGDITGANGNAIDIGEATDGTITFSRDDAGTVILTSADNDANAALTVAAGGTGALTLGDVGSTAEIVSSDWAISTIGNATGFEGIAFVPATTGANVSVITVGTSGSSLDFGDLTGANHGMSMYLTTDGAGAATRYRGLDIRLTDTGNSTAGINVGFQTVVSKTGGTGTEVDQYGANIVNQLSGSGRLNNMYGAVTSINIGASATIGSATFPSINYACAVLGQSYIDVGATTDAQTLIDGVIVAEVSDGANDRAVADGAFVAVLLGGSAGDCAPAAAFKVMDMEAAANNDFAYGLDLYYVDAPFTNVYSSADIRLSSGALIQTGTGDPNGSVTGVAGSIYLRQGATDEDATLYTCQGTTTWLPADL